MKINLHNITKEGIAKKAEEVRINSENYAKEVVIPHLITEAENLSWMTTIKIPKDYNIEIVFEVVMENVECKRANIEVNRTLYFCWL